MPHQPPEPLINLLERLGLATRQQVEGVAGRVRRLAGELPLFESVWVDALSQARVLTPFQAAEINAGRGESLRVGPYLLSRGLATNGLGQCFVARHAQMGRLVRVLRASCQDQKPARILELLRALIQDLHELQHPALSAPIEAGVIGGDCWVACEHVEGACVADWLAHNGRLPPAAVLEIAQQMVSALAALESRKRLHSDVGARQLILTKAGQSVLPFPGVRAILRPAEGYTRLDLLPEGYDYLAPERISAGTPPDMASEMFALGCLWWHLLCGRPPLSGGDALGKVRSAQQARIADVRRYAPDTPPSLVEAIAACTQSDPERRPRSMNELAAKLGPSEIAGQATLIEALHPPPIPTTVRRRPGRGSQQTASGGSLWSISVATMLIVGLGVWWLGNREIKLPTNQINGASAAVTISPPPVPPADAATALHRPPELVLSGQRVQLDPLKLQAGQTVRSDQHRRTQVVVPRGGLVITREDVRFENIDFASAEDSATLLCLDIERATFQGCSFQGRDVPYPLGIAIHWRGPATDRGVLRAGRLQLSDCVFHRLTGGVQVEGLGTVRLDFTNCLYQARGACVTLVDQSVVGEPCLIALTHCTFRGASALLNLVSSRAASSHAGELHIRAHDCAFALADDGALIAGVRDMPGNLRISGQGSILSMAAPLIRGLSDDQVEADGLVRSRMVFAGDNLSVPADSRLVSWQAPIASDGPPGILEKPLFLPARN